MSATAAHGIRPLRTRPEPSCPACGGDGEVAHRGLVDRLFGVPGTWTLRRCSAPACGLLWLDPVPLVEELGRAYAGYYTHATPEARGGGAVRRLWEGVKQGYLARAFGYRFPGLAWKRPASLALAPFPTRRESLDVTVLHLPAAERGRVLEVGCGAGDSLVALRDLGWRVEGLELDPAAAEVARARGLAVRVGALDDEPAGPEPCDAVAMVHVLEHLPDPRAALRRARRRLRPGGRLVVLTPNAAGRGHRRFGRAWRGLEPPRHLQVFTPAALRSVVEDAGFGVVEFRSTARMAAVLHAQSRTLEAADQGRPVRGGRAADVAFQLASRLALRRDPWAGEELLLIARADPGGGHG